MKSLLKYLKNYKKESVFAPLFKMLEASFELFVPLVVAKIIDNGIAKGDNIYVLKMGGALLLLAIIGIYIMLTTLVITCYNWTYMLFNGTVFRSKGSGRIWNRSKTCIV